MNCDTRKYQFSYICKQANIHNTFFAAKFFYEKCNEIIKFSSNIGWFLYRSYKWTFIHESEYSILFPYFQVSIDNLCDEFDMLDSQELKDMINTNNQYFLQMLKHAEKLFLDESFYTYSSDFLCFSNTLINSHLKRISHHPSYFHRNGFDYEYIQQEPEKKILQNFFISYNDYQQFIRFCKFALFNVRQNPRFIFIQKNSTSEQLIQLLKSSLSDYFVELYNTIQTKRSVFDIVDKRLIYVDNETYKMKKEQMDKIQQEVPIYLFNSKNNLVEYNSKACWIILYNQKLNFSLSKYGYEIKLNSHIEMNEYNKDILLEILHTNV